MRAATIVHKESSASPMVRKHLTFTNASPHRGVQWVKVSLSHTILTYQEIHHLPLTSYKMKERRHLVEGRESSLAQSYTSFSLLGLTACLPSSWVKIRPCNLICPADLPLIDFYALISPSMHSTVSLSPNSFRLRSFNQPLAPHSPRRRVNLFNRIALCTEQPPARQVSTPLPLSSDLIFLFHLVAESLCAKKA